MERATPACKVIKSPWTAAAPKCKVASHGVGRTNCLKQIVRRLNLRIYLYKDESKTAWLTSSKETIGIEKKHIKNLGIDMLRFFKPNFKKARKQSQDLQVPLIVTDRLYYFNQLKEEERSTSTLIAENVSSGSDTICNQPKEPIICKANLGEFKQTSLDKLLNNELVQLISSKDLVANIKAFTAKIPYRPIPNRVVKDYKECRISNHRRHLNSLMVLRASNRPKCTTDLIGFRRVMVSKKANKNPVLALKDPSKRLSAAELASMLEVPIQEAQDVITEKAELNGEMPNFEQTDLDPADSGRGVGLNVEAPNDLDCPPRMAVIVPAPQYHRRIEFNLENLIPLPFPQNDRPEFGQMLRRTDRWSLIASLLLFSFFLLGHSKDILEFQDWLLRLLLR